MSKKAVLAEEECKHGIWPPSCCTICTGKDLKVHTELVIIISRWTAKYSSKCSRCGDDIPVGAPIAQDTEDNYLCQECSS